MKGHILQHESIDKYCNKLIEMIEEENEN